MREVRLQISDYHYAQRTKTTCKECRGTTRTSLAEGRLSVQRAEVIRRNQTDVVELESI